MLPGANKAPERERLLIRAAWAEYTDVRGLHAIADTLAARYPKDPEAMHVRGLALTYAGRQLEGVEILRRLVAPDSSTSIPGECRSCASVNALVVNDIFIDSLAAAERVIRHVLRSAPESPIAWGLLATTLEHQAERVRRSMQFGCKRG